MASKTHIQWTDATVNFWTGCQKVSAGCKYCYMFRDQSRYGNNPTLVKRTSKNTFNAALKWKDPRRIFTCSWSDFFIEDADNWRDDAWDIIRKTPQHQWQILTKRPERIQSCLPKDWDSGYENVWLGVSVEDQSFIQRVEILRNISAKTKFISAEPLLGPLKINGHNPDLLTGIDWVIIGGESGNNTGKYLHRQCDEKWINDIIVDCQTTQTPVFVKQMGTYISVIKGYRDRHGGDISEWPKHLQIREFPR